MGLRTVTCALLMFGLLTSAESRGRTKKLNVTGQLSQTVAGHHQKKKFNKELGHSFLTMGSISFDGMVYDIRNRVKYQACVDLTADMSTVKQQNPALNSAYVAISGKFGEVKIGNSFSAATELFSDGTSLIGGDGGFSGTTLFSVFNPAAYSIIMTGCYYDPGYATQITYTTPKIRGMQVGVTYVPNSLHVGLLPENDSFNSMAYGMTTYAEPREENAYAIENKDLMAYGNGGFTSKVIAAGLRYDYGVPHHWNFSLSGGFWFGKANTEKKTKEPYKMRNLMAFAAGFSLGYRHVKLGFGYVNQLKSCLPKVRSKMTTDTLKKISVDDWKIITEGLDPKDDTLSNIADDLAALREGTGVASYNERKQALIDLCGFGEHANAGQIFTGAISLLPNSKIKMALGGIYAIRKMENKENVKTYGGSLTFDYRATQGIGLFLGFTYLKTKTCRRAVLISMSEAKSSAPFGDNDIMIVSAGVKMNF